MRFYRLVWQAFAIWLLVVNVSPNVLRAELPPGTTEALKRATVFIKVKSEKGSSQGSGFFVQDNLIATNAHVLGIEDPWTWPKLEVEVVVNSGTDQEKIIRAKLMGIDVPRDIAFVSLSEAVRAPSIKFLKTNTLIETTPVYVLGFPLGTKLDLNNKSPAMTIVSGQVSGFKRDAQQRLESIQVNASLIPGNSGGPIVDSQGRLVGISRATVMGTKLGFAIPADDVDEDLRGRVSAVAITPAADSKDKASLSVKLRAVDPLSRIQKAAVYYWTSDTNAKRPLDPISGIQVHGAAGDSPRQHVQLAKGDDGLWSGILPTIQVAADRELWIQAAIAGGNGLRLFSPVNHSRDQRERDQKTQAVEDEKATQAEMKKPPELREFNSRRKGASGRAAPKPIVLPNQFAKNVADEGESEPAWESRAQTVQLSDKKIIDMVADPRGDRLYAIFENDSQVGVYDSSDFKLKTTFSVARFPDSICWVNDRLVVASKSSRVVQFIDTSTYEPVHSARVVDRNSVPSCIVGEAPDGSVMTIWSHKDDEEVRALYLVDEKRDPLRLMQGQIDWTTILPGAEKIIVQSSSMERSTYAGQPVFWTMARRAQSSDMNFFFHDKPWDWNRCGRCLFDYRLNKLVMPACFNVGQDKYDQLTHFFKADATGDPEFTAPGYVLSLLGPANTCVSLELLNYGPATHGTLYYVDPTAGELKRQIQITGLSLEVQAFAKFNTNRHVEFVPGRELLLIVNQQLKGAIYVAPCASPAKPAKQGKP